MEQTVDEFYLEDSLSPLFGAGSIPDLHHLRYGKEIPDRTAAPFGVSGEAYNCLSCHGVDTSSGKIEILVERDCLVCHQPRVVETVIVDIKPGNNLNPINPKSKGLLLIAILGSNDSDVTEIDISSLLLEGEVTPLRWGFWKGRKGHINLWMRFSTQAVCTALGDLQPGQTYEVTITGLLKDGTEIEGSDSVVVVPPARGKRSKR